MKDLFDLLKRIQEFNEKMEKELNQEMGKSIRDRMLQSLKEADTEEKFQEGIMDTRKKFLAADEMSRMFKEGLENALKENVKKDKNKKS